MTRSLLAFGRTSGVVLFVLLTAVLATRARAERDMVQFGSPINVESGSTAHDTVCFFCSVNVKGEVNGNIVVFFGTARIDGQADHDVVVFFGDVKAADNASIGNNLVNFFGSVQLGENVNVGRDEVVMFGSLHAAPTANFGGNRVVQPGWIFWGPILLIFFGISYVVREVRMRRSVRILRGY